MVSRFEANKAMKDFVRRMFKAIFHSSILRRSWMEDFQILSNIVLLWTEFSSLVATLYADLTVRVPLIISRLIGMKSLALTWPSLKWSYRIN